MSPVDFAQLLATNDRRFIQGATPRELAAIALIRQAHLRPTSPFPDRRAYPYVPLPALRAFSRAWWRALGVQLRRRVHVAWLEQTAPACCLGYRYGHGWTTGHRVKVTHGGGPFELDQVPDLGPGWIGAGVERRVSTNSSFERLIDYDLVLQGPPADCPTCGTPPPRAVIDRWLEHAATVARRAR